jgi:outer membrane protein assembly factor BamB
VKPLRPGDPERIGSYRLLGRLGAGGMGVVYLGWSSGGRAVAVKVIRARFAADAEFRARFRREVAAARTVTGAFTAPLLDADPAAASPWLATAYLPGISLREAVDDAGALPSPALFVLAAGLAEAITEIHRAGLVHRDLKPDNIMLTAEGPRAIDFGIARPEDATALTEAGAVIGTPSFMSPEQIGGGPVGPPSDVFSFGAVLAFAATGKPPFGEGATLLTTLYRVLDVDTDLSLIPERWLRDVVAACLRRDAEDRPSAAEILRLLGEQAAASTWLPEPLASEIDRRAARARRWGDAETVKLELLVAEPRPPEPRPALGVNPGMSRQVGRRSVLVGGAALAAAAGGFAVQRWAGGRPLPASVAGGGGSRPASLASGGGSQAPGGSRSGPPSRGVVRWRVKVSDYYPDAVFTIGRIVLARTSEERLYALDAETGRTLWQHRASLGGAVVGNSVFQVQKAESRLALLVPRTGAQLWSSPTDTPIRIATSGSLVCYGGDRIRALSLADGRSRWTTGVDASAGLAVTGGTLLAAGKTRLAGLALGTGQVRWRRAMDSAGYLSAGGGLAFVVDRNWTLHAVRADNGIATWAKPAFTSLPQPAGRTLYASGGRNEVFALRSATGQQLWSRPLGGDSVLALGGTAVYAACTDKTLSALSATDGQVLWTHRAEILQPPLLTSDCLAASDGQVFAGVKTGHVEAVKGPRAGA